MRSLSSEEVKRSLPGVDELISEARKYKLIGNEIFDEFSHDELVEQYNGVGPDRFPGIVRNLLSYLISPALPAVIIHDLKYYKGGNFDDFRRSNLELKKNARILAKKKYKWYHIGRWRLWAVARLLQKFTDKYGLAGWNMR